MSEHTPGPLQIVEAKTLDNSGQWHVYLAAPDGRKIAALWGNQDEKEGNARLFTAAPDMLEVLNAARIILKNRDQRPEEARLLDAIKIAIAKATQVSQSSALQSER